MNRSRRLPRSALATLCAWQDTISRRPLLTAEQERDLARAAQAGDRDARDRLIESNVRLVLSVVPRYMPRSTRMDIGLSAEDLIQEGMLGLHVAARKFDPERGFRFSTYATPWIHQAISRALSERGNEIRTTHGARKRLARDGEEPPAITQSLDERQRMGMTAEPGRLRRDPPDLAPLPDALTLTGERRNVVADAIATLPPRMQRVVRLRFGFGPDGEAMTLQAVADIIGLTRERIRQIEREALRRLRLALPDGAW